MPGARVDILGPTAGDTDGKTARRLSGVTAAGVRVTEQVEPQDDSAIVVSPPDALPQEDDALRADVPVESSADAPAEAPADAAAANAGALDAQDGKPEGKPKAPAKPRDPAVIRAFRAGAPIDGTVEKVIKGGYEVRVGRSRGFCPHSQIDVHRVDNPDEHVGKTYAFRILQLRRGGDDVVVSRRALLEAEHSEEMKAVRATLIEGAVMTGRVTRIAEFGAFVDLGAGVTGLAHLSELAHGRVVRASDVVSVGDRVPVKITKLDEATGKVSLSIKQAITDPWESVPQLFEIGKAYPGKVKRFAEFGVFVELRRGIEALAPAREFPPTETDWREGLEADATRDWIVIATDPVRRRITIIPAFDGWDGLLGARIEPGAKLKGRISKAEVFGVFVWLGPGHVGMIPRVWSGAANGPGFERRFPAGAEIAVEVVDVQEGGKRIRLAVEGVDRDAAEAAQAHRREAPARPKRELRPSGPRHRDEAPAPQHASASQGAFGSHLGEALKAALGKRED
jgi:small subunit ribosomal protein S1